MTKDQLFETVMELLMEFHIDEQHEILSELKNLADVNWENMCDAAWADYSFGI